MSQKKARGITENCMIAMALKHSDLVPLTVIEKYLAIQKQVPTTGDVTNSEVLRFCLYDTHSRLKNKRKIMAFDLNTFRKVREMV